MSVTNVSIPKPKNWQDFETRTRMLFAYVLNDPNTQQNGRSGQKQHGVDIYGNRDKRSECLVGIQCKKKFDRSVTEKELRAELEKAKSFKPPISEFILVTTAPRDAKIQEVARLITAELAGTDRPIGVFVWGWDDIEEQAVQHPEVWKAFDPTYNQYVERSYEDLKLTILSLKQSLDEQLGTETRSPLRSETDVKSDQGDNNTPRHGKITTLQCLVDDGHAKVALAQLLKLKGDEWRDATASERFRLLVSIASAKLKLGAYTEAGQILLDAYPECPEHKNAQINRAKGHLLTNNHREAVKLARELLGKPEVSADAAETLIQALIPEPTCDDPLSEIPEALRESEKVLVARICFMRARDNPGWAALAKAGVKKFPDSRLLRLFSAEGVLDGITRTSRDAIAGGILQNVTAAEFDNAVEELSLQARDAIEKGYCLLPSTAQNAALALRLTEDLPTAKDILDAAITQHPDDESLRLQRSIIAYSENDFATVVATLPKKPSHPEGISILANTLVATNRPGDALSLLNETNDSGLPRHVRLCLLTARVRAYVQRGEKGLATDIMAQRVVTEPRNLSLRCLQIRTYRMVADEDAANKAFAEALGIVTDETSLRSRLQLSFEAKRLSHHDAIVDLLNRRVTTDRESDALKMLIGAAIDARRWVTAREIMASASVGVRDRLWFKKAEAILAIDTGDLTADEKIARCLELCPNDVELVLVRIGIWQRSGREGEIADLLNQLDLTKLEGRPEARIRIGTCIVRYGDPGIGLHFAYKVLLDNWNVAQAHLTYQGLIFMTDNVSAAMPEATAVAEGTVVCLEIDGQERRYRIENEHYPVFGDERLDYDNDLAKVLIGKRVGDTFNLQEGLGSQAVKVCWIKHIYLDAFHCSLEQFNERFLRADGLIRLKVDSDAADPFADIRAITKARAEVGQRILDEYRTKNLPLAFAAALLGKDPLDAWSGLPSDGIKFHLCRGTLLEREEAVQVIKQHGRKGCVVDAITLSIIRRLGLENAVISVCGALHTTQSVIDLLAFRAFEAAEGVGKKQGHIGWRNERLWVEEFSEEVLKNAAEERAKEISWARRNLAIVPAMPKDDFSQSTRTLAGRLGQKILDPATAADGNGLLLLSEDMGFRIWAADTFKVFATWLQPVLMVARAEGNLNAEQYSEAVNTFALSGHIFISLDHNCLLYQARKNNFEITDQMARLLSTAGGPMAELSTNSRVLSTFIDTLWQECPDALKVKRLASECFVAMTNSREEDQRQIVGLIVHQLRKNKALMYGHALAWLIGHSIGLPCLDELLRT